MRKCFNILNFVKVSENEDGYYVSSEFCRMDVTGYHIKSSFSGRVEIEAKLERDMYSRCGTRDNKCRQLAEVSL